MCNFMSTAGYIYNVSGCSLQGLGNRYIFVPGFDSAFYKMFVTLLRE
jgi:hypothetical protein